MKESLGCEADFSSKKYKYHVVRLEFKTAEERDEINNYLFSLKIKHGKSMAEVFKDIVDFHKQNK